MKQVEIGWFHAENQVSYAKELSNCTCSRQESDNCSCLAVSKLY